MNWLKFIVGWLDSGVSPFDHMFRQRSFPANMAGKMWENEEKTGFLAGEAKKRNY